jgi:hypothetical protein
MAEPNNPRPFSRLAEELIGELRHSQPAAQPRYSIGGRAGRPKDRATQPLPAVLDQLLQKYQIGRSTPEQTIRDHWAQLVGSANAAYSNAVSIEKGRLLVLVSHAVVRNELFHHKDQIVERIQKLPGCADVKSLNLRSG